MRTNILTHFNLKDREYWYSKGIYFTDNGTIREQITEKEYKNALMDKLIEG